ncbi:hypothetical protein LY625_09415 [Lysobacter sp. GX 14042]|nr:hypothetical protein [Lysobacter sp. GX 14042]MCE7032826.1 hypothetical protein [Lysobacter sp. GX 14042]
MPPSLPRAKILRSMNALRAHADILTSARMAAGMTSRARRRSTDIPAG